MMAMMIAVSTVCVCTMSSCSDDDDDTKFCTCTESDPQAGYSASQQIDPKSFGATNCSDLQVKLRMSNGDPDMEYSCH